MVMIDDPSPPPQKKIVLLYSFNNSPYVQTGNQNIWKKNQRKTKRT